MRASLHRRRRDGRIYQRSRAQGAPCARHALPCSVGPSGREPSAGVPPVSQHLQRSQVDSPARAKWCGVISLGPIVLMSLASTPDEMGNSLASFYSGWRPPHGGRRSRVQRKSWQEGHFLAYKQKGPSEEGPSAQVGQMTQASQVHRWFVASRIRPYTQKLVSR
jgi:hypothetical protein